MHTITKILNEHYNHLNWIDKTTFQLENRIQEIKFVAESRKP